jgi:alpha-tubulin suppressor-like RCC1 family protein
MLIPTRVHFLSTDQERKELYRFQTNKYPHTGVNGNKNSLQFTDIACGTFHSLATDVNSNVWSWGGRGDLCLGHGDSQLTGVWAERCKSVFPTLSTANKLMVPFDLLDWCKKWSVPRLIKSLQFQRSDDLSTNEDKVIQISGGDMHSSILFQSGRMYFCGNGPVVSPIQIKVEEEDEDEDEGDEGSESKADANAHLNEAIRELEKKLVTVSTPRCPSSLWYERLSVRKIKYIASAGRQ